MAIYYMDGEFVESDSATVAANDLSVLRGFGVFDFFRSYNSIPFLLDRHVIRLETSAKLIGLKLPKSNKEIADLILETISRNDFKEYTIRLILTGGESSSNFSPEEGKAKLFIMPAAVEPLAPSCYENGVKVVTTHTSRFMPGSKTINYIPGILAVKEAKKQGAMEAIYVDERGFLQEGTTSNFFACFGDKIVTAPTTRILPGITREVFLQVAAKNGLEIEERLIHQDEISLMTGAFVTAANKEILPVCEINSTRLCDAPTDIMKKAMQVFYDHTRAYQGE